MNPDNRRYVANFLGHLGVVGDIEYEQPWSEERLVFELAGKIYLITDNFPHWTTSQVLDFLKSQNIKPYKMKVLVTPVSPEEDDVK